MLDVEVITEERRFDALEPIWNPLLIKSAAKTLFLTFEWMRTWWRFYGEGQELCLLLFSDGEEPVAIAPLFRQKRTFGEVEQDMTGSEHLILPGGKSGGFLELTELGFLGTGPICSDFLDIFCLPEYEEEVADSFAEYLFSTLRGWDLLNLLEMPDHSPVAIRLHQRWKNTKCYRRRLRYTSYSAPLPGDYEKYLKTLSRKSRYNARKKLRELKKRHEDVGFEYHTDPDKLEEQMDQFIALHQKRWNEEGLPGAFATDAFIGFHKTMSRIGLERGWLRLGFLTIDNQRDFGLYAYSFEDVLYLYQQGGSAKYPRLNLGYAAYALAIRKAVEEGLKEYDFLRGDARYKMHWAKKRRGLYQVQVFRQNFCGRHFRLHSQINTSPLLRSKAKKLFAKG